jgi:hypothetical protein
VAATGSLGSCSPNEREEPRRGSTPAARLIADPLMNIFQVSLVALVATILLVGESAAATIVSVTGPEDRFPVVGGTNAHAVGWSQSAMYSNIEITAELATFRSGGNGTAFLTTRIGPGTTVADQIASANFAFPPKDSPPTLLFRGLELSAGTYYLTIRGTTDAHTWAATDLPVTSNDMGAATLGDSSSNNASSYPPATAFNVSDFTKKYAVTGLAVPEPSSAIATLFAIVLLTNRRSRRLHASFAT